MSAIADRSDPDRQMTVAEAGERAVIERIRRQVPPPPAWVTVGIGDDAAVLEPERNQLEVITTDSLVEGIHFDRRVASARSIGHKALAVNLSDLAAMGAAPRVALLSLVLPDAFELVALDELIDGLLSLARRYRVELVGGNITRSPGPLIVDVTLVGSVKRRRVLTRGQARAGDEVYLSGTIGAASAGFQRLTARVEGLHRDALAAADSELSDCEHRFLEPDPRLRLGVLLGRNRAATACVDLSDGLGDAVRQIASASGVGIIVDAEAIPVHPGARRWFDRCGREPIEAALRGGEDYELLFTVSPKRRSRYGAVRRVTKDVTVTRIGRVTADRAVVLRRDGHDVELPAGFTHF